MNLTESLPAYFRGEQHLGIGLAVFGVLALAAAFWVWRTQVGAFAWWLMIPLALVGAGAGIGGAALAVKTQAQVTRLVAQLDTEPAALVTAETSRMARVNANWPRLKVAWSVVIVAALGLLLFVHREWASGLGLALLLTATTLFFVDVFAERRASVYTAALEHARAAER
ncbi:MAG TPA: hypothetical protein VNM90_01445 [Haliangium sp.]|nr:hypothetical protein [Haliangium sp.]